MKKKNTWLKIACVSFALIMLISLGVSAAETKINYGEKLDNLVELLKTKHIYYKDGEDPIRKGLISMFEKYPGFFEAFVNEVYQSYDRYSHYFDAETYDKVYPKNDSKVGIGITIEEKQDGCYIKGVYTGPAQTAGLLTGDKIIKIDGQTLEGYSPSMIGTLISGPEGSAVVVTISRDGKEQSFTVKRANIALSNVGFKDLGDGVGYLEISHFSGTQTFMDFSLSYDDLPDKGINTVIIDLRNNPGGDLSCLVNIMDGIIPEKGIPYLMTWQSKPMQVRTLVSEGYGWQFNKLIILVNEYTASAAEVMSGALQDLGYADLVGTKTYGKGLAQIHTQLADGSNAIISASEMMLPTTGTYDGVGIKPNYLVDLKYEPLVIPNLAGLDLNKGVYKISDTNVLGVEQRLKALGYFDGTPDKTADLRTFFAINQFQKASKIEVTKNYCESMTVQKIDNAFKELQKKPVARDTQYEKAVLLAKKYAKSKTKAKSIPAESIRFTS